MKNKFLIFIIIAILSTPFLVISVITLMKVDPETINQIQEPEKPIVSPVLPSASFMEGYWDGWYGKWLGPIRWTVNRDYRQGHMLGTYDKKNNIYRFSMPKSNVTSKTITMPKP